MRIINIRSNYAQALFSAMPLSICGLVIYVMCVDGMKIIVAWVLVVLVTLLFVLLFIDSPFLCDKYHTKEYRIILNNEPAVIFKIEPEWCDKIMGFYTAFDRGNPIGDKRLAGYCNNA